MRGTARLAADGHPGRRTGDGGGTKATATANATHARAIGPAQGFVRSARCALSQASSMDNSLRERFQAPSTNRSAERRAAPRRRALHAPRLRQRPPPVSLRPHTVGFLTRAREAERIAGRTRELPACSTHVDSPYNCHPGRRVPCDQGRAPRDRWQSWRAPPVRPGEKPLRMKPHS